MHPMDHLNAIARQHQQDQEAARRAAEAGPPGPPEMEAPVVSAWFIGGAALGFAVGYLALEHVIFATVLGLLTGVAARIFQAILRALGAGAINRALGGLPQWAICGGLLAAFVGVSFMVWLEGMAADVVTPALTCAPVGAAAAVLVRGVMLLAGAGRTR
jgi:hypothetical protein